MNCTGASTDQLLLGDFIDFANTPAVIIYPPNNATVSTGETFSWNPAANATGYTIEISVNSSFTNVVLRSDLRTNTYSVVASDLIGISSLDAVQYYWRVTVRYPKKSATSSGYTFHLLDDAIYVDANSTATSPTGTKSAPYASIPDAIAFAKLKGKVVRVSKGTYYENTIRLKPGVSIYGGYDSGANWSRNITANTTTISSVDSTGFAVAGYGDITLAFRATTNVDGFTINALGGMPSTSAIYLSNANATISNNTLNGNNASTSSNGINIVNSGTPIIVNNTINAANATGSSGVGISGATPIVAGNIIFGGTSGTNAYGIFLGTTTTPVIANNTIYVSGTTNSFGIYISDGTPVIVNNIVFTTSGSNRRGVHEQNAGTSSPVTFQNNLIFDCPQGLYVNNPGGAFNTDVQINDFNNSTQMSGTASGNIGATSIANFAAVNFVSASDFHLQNPATPAIIRNGGKDTSASTCGATGTSSCGGVTTDRDGNLRTVPYSIGAYERD